MPAPKAEHIPIQGLVKWSSVHQLDPMYGSWHVTIYPTPDSLNKIRDLQAEGLKNVIKKDDENQYYVKFTRYPWKEYKDRGGRIQRITFDAPTVVDRQGAPYRDIIGGGSSVTLDLEVYEHGIPGSDRKAKAARLTGLMIDELVPYSRNDFTEQQEKVTHKMELVAPANPQW